MQLGDNGKLFRENEVWNYTTIMLREDLGLIMLGTRGVIYALDINDITKKKASVRAAENYTCANIEWGQIITRFYVSITQAL